MTYEADWSLVRSLRVEVVQALHFGQNMGESSWESVSH